ncbi:MAG: hypothetical protein V3V86_05970, partial [Gammaproteobacteria bacterium]
MTEHDEGNDSLEIRQLAALYARARNGAFATLVLTGVVVVLLWGRVDERALILWAIASAVLEGARIALAARFRDRSRRSEESARWMRTALAPAAAAGLLWGLPAVYLAGVGSDWALMTIFALPVAIMALAGVSYALHRTVHPVHVLFAAGPPVVVLLTQASANAQLAGVALAGLAMMSLYSGQLTAQRVRENLALRRATAELEARLQVIHDHIGS